MKKLLSGFILLALLAGCSSDKKDPYVERPVEDIYNSAYGKMENSQYRQAANEFLEVERQHPYSAWANKGQIMAAYSYYQALRYDEALQVLDDFIELHPGSGDLPYAYYLRALCYYEQISDVTRDQAMTQKALDALHDVERRFPNTQYARDARLKIDLTNDHLAGKEMEIGRFYEKRHIIQAAINRYRIVVDKYQTTSQVPEALFRLVETNLSLGLVDEAKRNAAVLGYNYPGSDWYEDAYVLLVKDGYVPSRQKESWWKKLNPL